jgi:hypothetical protein
MNIENEIKIILCCNICDKIYASMSSLCNHNKKFHSKNIKKKVATIATNIVNVATTNINVVETANNITKPINSILDNKLYCKYCNFKFKSQSNKCQHEKRVCGKKLNIINTDIKAKNELDLEKIKLETMNISNSYELEKLREEKEILRLKIKLQNCKKLDNKTFKAVNKFLMDRSFKNSNNNNNTTNSHNSNTVNNIVNNTILSIGNEQLVDILTMKEKKKILAGKFCSLEKIVDMVHCGKYDKFKNIVITNLKDNYAYKYDEKLGYFITGTKNDILNDAVSYRITDIVEIYDELSSANKIDDTTKEIIQRMLDKIQNEKLPYYDHDEDTKYINYKSYKINNIKILLYNNHDRITKDIALLFSNDLDKISIDI